MGKRILQLYADDEDIILSKSKGINLSSLFREILKLELYGEEKKSKTDKEKIKDLKLKLLKANVEIEEKLKEIESLKKKADKNSDEDKWEILANGMRVRK